MSVPNFSFLACLEVSEKFVVGWCWFHVSTMSNLNPSKIELELGLGFDDNCHIASTKRKDPRCIKCVWRHWCNIHPGPLVRLNGSLDR